MQNVILVTVDCWRHDRCGFNGHHRDTTPTLDSIAKESIVFNRAYSTGPYTTESFPGIIGGQHSYNGCYFGDDPAWKAFEQEDTTLAKSLSDVGYSTVATLSNPHLTKTRNFDLGFDRFRNLRTKGKDNAKQGGDNTGWAGRMYNIRSYMRRYSSLINPYTLPFILYRYRQLSNWPTVSGEDVVTGFLSDLESTSRPFFGWTHLMDVHAPINPERAREGGLMPKGSNLRQFSWDAARASRIHEPRYDTMYDSAIRYVDQQLSVLISELKNRSLWDETILIITGDHGEVLWDRDQIYGHPRHHLYDDLLHVPLLVRTPEGSHKRINKPFSLAWIPDLISQLLDVNSGNFPEKSNTDWINDTGSQDIEYVVSDTLDSSGHSVAVRTESRKVIHHRKGTDNDSKPDYRYFQEPIQFNYLSDPKERDGTEPDSDIRTQAADLLTAAESLSTVGEGFDPDMEQQLQDLGYKM
ncbi:sulfatase [Haloarcula sp. CBA1131]|uniref:sulfatase n=1 Tax=Haloarcula sp. CBA1131 TaxID=1853686 RepID=UPI0012459566|nr:sulfatase [Haloarcula sp. CBA1131]KAA9407022.1 sulfatase [Haloarcula sp. CBA1131]